MRLFVSLACPPEWATAVAALQSGVTDARWQTRLQLHITLSFLGELEEPVAQDVHHALQAVRAPPLCLSLQTVGTFARKERVHSLWTGVIDHSADQALAALAAQCAQACRLAGVLVAARRYIPHLTLARLAKPRADCQRWLKAHAGFAASKQQFGAFHLMQSELAQSGAQYSTLASYPLRG